MNFRNKYGILKESKGRRIFYVYQNDGNLGVETLNRFSFDPSGLPFFVEVFMGRKGQSPPNKGTKMSEEKKEHLRKIFKARYQGAGNPSWKGGRAYQTRGYVLVHKADHPYRMKDNYVLEHRYVMEQHIGRYLRPEEVVHHENKNVADNRIENLKLFENQGKHVTYHKNRRLQCQVN